ncbi:porin [Leptospira sp. 'Mane']|uniref:porin n=1 Tax=Leptospira sp. 'Mane' TaxID=3387407 RepID=UPI00398B0233
MPKNQDKYFIFLVFLLIYLPISKIASQTGEPYPLPTKTDPKKPVIAKEEKTNTEKPPKLRMAFGKGLDFESPEEDASLNLRLRFQGRYTQGNSTNPDGDPTELQLRRARIALRGYVMNKDWQYYMQLGFSDQDMEKDRPVPLRDAVLTYAKYRDFNISGGQMKVPFNRERVISDGIQEFVDRTISNGELNLDRDVGVQVFSNNFLDLNHFGYNVGVFGGDGRNKTSHSPGVLSIAKLTYYPLGCYTDTGEPDLDYSSSPKLSFSVFGAKNVNTNRTLSTFGDTYDFARFTYNHSGAEFVLKWIGFSFSGEYLVRDADAAYREKEIGNQLKREYSRSARGEMIQFGYLLTQKLGVAFRFSEYYPIAKTDPTLTYSRERGIALSYYIQDHNLKIQADYSHQDGEVTQNYGSEQFRIQMQIYL